MLVAYSPSGVLIDGTLESLLGRAHVHVTKNVQGHVEIEFLGETEIFWNEQKTVEQDDEIIYLDEEGGIWKESEIVWKEEADA